MLSSTGMYKEEINKNKKVRFHVEIAKSKKAFIFTQYYKHSGKEVSPVKYYCSFIEFSHFVESIFSTTKYNIIQFSVDNHEISPPFTDGDGVVHECWDGMRNLTFEYQEKSLSVCYKGLGLSRNLIVPVVEYTNTKYVEILMQMVTQGKLIWDLDDFIYKEDYKER